MSAWDIYWLTRLEPLRGAFEGCAAGFGILLLIAVCFIPILANDYMFDDPKHAKTLRRFAFKGVPIGFALSLLGSIATPTKSDLAIIFAGAWATNSEEMQKLPDNVVGTLNKFMRSYIDEKPEAGK